MQETLHIECTVKLTQELRRAMNCQILPPLVALRGWLIHLLHIWLITEMYVRVLLVRKVLLPGEIVKSISIVPLIHCNTIRLTVTLDYMELSHQELH